MKASFFGPAVVVVLISAIITSVAHSASGTAAEGYVPDRIELEQNWTEQTRERFWFTSQGARILPYSWFVWLEQKDSETLFRDGQNMESYRYLPQKASSLNPGGLPIGFALATEHVVCAWYDLSCKDGSVAREWVGLTCAACHTNQLDYNGKHYLIEGAPTLANFVTFFRDLIDAMNQTAADQDKFDRFARNVLGNGYDAGAADALRAQLGAIIGDLALRQDVNKLPAHYPEDFTSFARLDAFGNIQNAASAFALHDPANSHAPAAPVSYPFLWGTHQSDVVQWNGTAPNTPVVGPLVRNMGEVVGVFGSLSIEKAPFWLFWRKTQYSSTVNMPALGDLECWVRQLRSPAWPDEFPTIDPVKAAAGEVLYAKHCAACHQVIPRAHEGEKYKAVMIPQHNVGTDPAMVENAAGHEVKTLVLDGSKEAVLIGKKFGPTSPAITIAVNGVVGLVLNRPITAIRSGLKPTKGRCDVILASEAQEEADSETDSIDIEQIMKEYIAERAKKSDDGLKYKARPMNGIWATAPYLHNGSVPNLYELLKPPADRANEFHVGSREFDAQNVGYRTDQGPSVFRVKGEDGKVQPGNDNAGHDYGTQMSDEERWALVEYMKSL